MVNFFKKTAIQKDASLKLNWPDTYDNKGTTINVTGGNIREKALFECLAASIPPVGDAKLEGFRLG